MRPHVTTSIRSAIEGEGLSIVYQPVVDIRTGAIVGAEALARFSAEPRRGPDVWFAEAWDAGLGLELEVAAIKLAIVGLERFPADAYLAVNASPTTLMSPELFEVLQSAPACRIVVEVTEHMRIDDYTAVVAAVAKLRTLGVRLSVDDAGAGFASFQHVLRLRPDVIKLDRSLTADIDQNPVRAALAGALVTFAGSLGARICAEGIERIEELTVLQKLGIAYGQGYFLARPAPLPFPEIPKGMWFAPPPIERSALLVSPAVRDLTRLAALDETELLDSGPDEKFDRFTRLVTGLLGVPMALISLVAGDRQYFKSTQGVPESVRQNPSTSLTHSLCQHTVTTQLPLIIEDTREHPLVRDNGAVTELGISAYMGIPLLSEGQALGTLCALDMAPRQWTEEQVLLLGDLAAMLATKLELRQLRRRVRDDRELFRAMFDHTDAALSLSDVEGRIVRVSRKMCSLLGRDPAEMDNQLVASLYAGDEVIGMFRRSAELLTGQAAQTESLMHPVRSDGGRVAMKATTTMIRAADGAARYFLTTFTPVVALARTAMDAVTVPAPPVSLAVAATAAAD
jgi:PAS domain S-box-containing protein